ncbi:MAG: MetQ/NlpA family ABC transporter substrate-binding protein [Mobilicoccus sp.]|nr:MetQ/NlpA family ABC transporter substrate-binding protein [Mobilicoccus sp.]
MSLRALPTIAIALTATLGLAACGTQTTGDAQGGEQAESSAPLTIMADAEPHATLLRQAQEQGLLGDTQIDIREITGQVDPNQLVASGDLDANFFQHAPYLKNWNNEHNADLQLVGTVHIEPLGLYSRKIDNVDALSNGANIAIPADAVNQGRALFLLADAGVLTLDVDPQDPGLDIAQVGQQNISENPKNVTFTEIDRPQLAASLDDPAVEASIVNGNYALEAGLRPDQDALALDNVENNPYANGLVTRPELVDDARVQAVVEALKSQEIQDYITETYQGSVLPAQGDGEAAQN